MKKKILAFTMIELIVVISIISIISITSINGFFNFIDDKQAKMKIGEISILIDNLDKKIKNYDIYDYKTIFDTNIKDSYIIKENFFDLDNYADINYDYINNSGSININNLDGKVWILSIYKDKKLIFNDSSLNNNFKKNDFEKNYDYKILSTLSGTTDIKKLNSIDLIRIDKENNLINLEKVTTSIGGTNIGNVEIVNIGGKKSFYNSGSLINTNEIYLYFETKGRENYIKITK
ncbi:MAG: prepilin-type N-terminal cleavage/methylation domain-containing protein [Candidatus Gracilibacteria bacterium]|nr:prepilin-type N-terminal cleavage/methylation domain-containing protein [Candidatus Gracilibacteria bacterium]